MSERIKVHEKALAHLSKGLYRSPASAIRELVSNAWDAGATKVEIETGVPAFARLIVTDNGRGFGREQFERLMRGGIGSSEKRSAEAPPTHFARPVLGRLGIGLMGVAQMCAEFEVLSRTESGEAFAARVSIANDIRRRMDQDDPKYVPSHGAKTDDVFIGEWEEIPTPKFSSDWHGTQIVLTEPLPTLVETLARTLRPVDAKVDSQSDEMASRLGRGFPTTEEMREAMPPRDWSAFCKATAAKESVTVRGAYWKFIWELAAACPVMYVSERAVPQGRVKNDQARLESYKFKVFVDGIELRKPALFARGGLGFTTREFAFEQRIDDHLLKCHGYLLVQDGSQLRPAELRGIQIRVKDVGIGFYDGTLLEWQVNQGPRSRWVSGEVFVDEGLEDAVNVDRDSFNRFHPDYAALQEKVHAELKKVFTPVYQKLTERSKQRRADRIERQRAETRDMLEQAVVRGSGPREVALGHDAELPKLVVARKGSTEVRLESHADLPLDDEQRLLVHAVIALWDLVHLKQGRSVAERRAVFIAELVTLLKKW